MIKEKIPLIIALTLPLLMIIFVAASIYLPTLFSKPQYDFVYAMGDYNVYDRYFIKNNQIDLKPYPPASTSSYTQQAPILFIYHTTTNTSEEIDLETAKKLKINSNTISPDGFEIVPGTRNSSFIFFSYSSSDYSQRYIKKGAASRKLNLAISDQYYQGTFHLLGWVIQ